MRRKKTDSYYSPNCEVNPRVSTVTMDPNFNPSKLPKPNSRNSVYIRGQVWHLKLRGDQWTVTRYSDGAAAKYMRCGEDYGDAKWDLIAVLEKDIQTGVYPLPPRNVIFYEKVF